MRQATEKEFSEAVAKAGWPAARMMSTARSFDAYYSDRGTEVASRHYQLKRGKQVGETIYFVNPTYLSSEASK